ncbi:transmembrane sensor [Pedobacter africanus]|uniref:Ferric-dicitrate binding protein FerR (Iron transport regulator) n=1 Tax=Pedobacter africanus TaxID=151894 RepID=A0ACC6L199_9SPHI|nr:FecR family protein [Pedobacter africanus]MDR6785277.1 ferric-dicitrate binding protein FerR (iron transport regulator) [Pedobacter africanus]
MENKDIKDDLVQVSSGKYSTEQQQIAERWLFQLNMKNKPGLSEAKLDDAEAEVWRRLEERKVILTRRFRLWPRIAVAASIALSIGIGSLLYFNSRDKQLIEQVAQHDVNPGQQGATLTLANGTKIRLSEVSTGKLADEAGVIITKTANGELIYEIKSNTNENKINTISTSNGETYRVKLPDGSVVWLNSGSSLTYAANLIQNKKRTVQLAGEGYFEITKNKSHPFIVKTADQEVEVLGTHFNINSYKDELTTTTTLLEGSVKISAGKNVKTIVPGDQARNNGGQISVAKVNTENVTDWKDGEFNLDGLDFRMAMRKISRWYDVEVVYDKSVPEDIQSGGWIPRDNKLSSILKLIENSGQVKFRVEGKKVYVYK